MLIFKHKPGDAAYIELGDTLVKVVFVGVCPLSNQATIGFEAPRDVEINREKVYFAKKVQREMQQGDNFGNK